MAARLIILAASFALSLAADMCVDFKPCGEAEGDCTPFLTEGSNVNFSIRTYQSQFWASTVPSCDYSESSSFWALARYIGVFTSPQNDQDKKMPMTAPVLMTHIEDESCGEKTSMAFWASEDFQSNMPKPTNEEVKIVTKGPMRVAVRCFKKGWFGRGGPDIEEELQKLRDAIADTKGIEADETVWFRAGYNSPMTFTQHNEVWVPIRNA